MSDERTATTYDRARRRASVRKGREAGCWIYVPAVELREAGYKAGEPPPFYRVFGQPRGSVLVRLYRRQ